MNTEEENKPDTTNEDNTQETPKGQGANVQNEPHDVLVETVTPGSHTQETDTVKESEESTSESELSTEQDTNEEENTEAATEDKPDDVHVETVTPDDGGEAPEDDETDTSKEKPEESSSEKADGKEITDEQPANQKKDAEAKSDNIDIPTVTPNDSADPGIEVEDDASKEHPFHDAAEAEKNGDGTASADIEENEQDANESSNKEAGPKGENL